jgi:hypothetical protein
MMIIRREVINFALDKNHKELLADPEQFYRDNYQVTQENEGEDDDREGLNNMMVEQET